MNEQSLKPANLIQDLKDIRNLAIWLIVCVAFNFLAPTLFAENNIIRYIHDFADTVCIIFPIIIAVKSHRLLVNGQNGKNDNTPTGK